MISLDILPLLSLLSLSFLCSSLFSPYRKDIKFSLVPNLAVTDVSNEIRKQCGLHSAAPFNLKYLDVESKSHHVLYMYMYICCVIMYASTGLNVFVLPVQLFCLKVYVFLLRVHVHASLAKNVT